MPNGRKAKVLIVRIKETESPRLRIQLNVINDYKQYHNRRSTLYGITSILNGLLLYTNYKEKTLSLSHLILLT